LRLDKFIKERSKLVRMKGIVEYLHSNLTDEILDEFMKIIEK
jgi:hypothetical protein